MADILVTTEEQKANASLKRLAKKWPENLSLFSWAGSLHVMKRGEDDRLVSVGDICGIDNDGGDPSALEVNHSASVVFE